MKILHCADFHGCKRWFDWLLQIGPAFDVVCIAGDLLDAKDEVEALRQIRIVHRLAGVLSSRLLLCSGNHDYDVGNANWVSALNGKRTSGDGAVFELGGLPFRCCGWLEPLSPPERADEVWVVHAPPDQSPVGTSIDGDDLGDFEFGELCRNGRGPQLALCGHAHRPRRWFARIGMTTLLNPGRVTLADWPAHIVIDTKVRTAERRSPCSGVERCSLG